MFYDKITGKPIDNPSDYLPKQLNEECEHCGTKLIARCLQCGAPVCCPKCCDETTNEYQNDVQAAAGGMTQTAIEY